MHPGKSLATPARQRTALGDIKNTPAVVTGPSIEKPQMVVKSGKSKQSKEPGHGEKTEARVKGALAGLGMDEFPDIETMHRCEPESKHNEGRQGRLCHWHYVMRWTAAMLA